MQKYEGAAICQAICYFCEKECLVDGCQRFYAVKRSSRITPTGMNLHNSGGDIENILRGGRCVCVCVCGGGLKC